MLLPTDGSIYQQYVTTYYSVHIYVYVVRMYNGNAYQYYVAFYRSLWQRVSLLASTLVLNVDITLVLREAGKESQFAFRNTFFCILLFIRWSYVGSSILVGTKVVVNSYMRLRNKFKLFPTKNQLTQQVHCTPGLEWRTGMVFGRKWLEFISHSQTKGDYNFRYYICFPLPNFSNQWQLGTP